MINTRFDDWYTILLISFSLARSKLLVLTHTHEHSLIPFHIFFSLRYYFVVHDSGLVPAKLPALLRSLLSLYFCLFKTKQNRLYYRVFLPPVSFFRERCSFFVCKIFFLLKETTQKCQYTETSLSLFGRKKGERTAILLAIKIFRFSSHAYLLRILPSAALICWYFTSLSLSLRSISGHHIHANKRLQFFSPFFVSLRWHDGEFFPIIQ